MSKSKTFFVAIIACIAIGLTGVFYGYSTFKKTDREHTAEIHTEFPNIQAYIQNESLHPFLETGRANQNRASIPRLEVYEEAKITPDTTIIYEYYYLGDGEIEESTETAPYFLLNLTESELASAILDWQILSFSEEEVTLRKTVLGSSSNHFILGIENGYVAVFYKEANNEVVLQDVTRTPVSSLSIDEQIRLKEGIIISDENRLIKALEDFGS